MRPKPLNLLLLTVDAWRADFVDTEAGVPLTPTLHTLLPAAARFANAYASAPWTSPALVSLFCGENPALHGVHHEWSAPRAGGPALVARLCQAGYHAPNICYLNRVGNYQNLGYAASDAPDYPAGPDDDLLLRALRSTEEPWFLWYHYKFVHLPYWPGPAYRRLFDIDDARLPEGLAESVCRRFVVPRREFSLAAEDRELVRRLYAASVRQFDDFFGRVLETLSQKGLLKRTSLVLTADHGDELLEHGHVGHASTAHHATLYEEVLRVPLIIADPRLHPAASGSTFAERVQALDLFPTLLSLCGVSADAGGAAASSEAVDLAPLLLDGRRPETLAPTRRLFFQSARMGYLTPRSHAEQFVYGLLTGQRKYICERYDEAACGLFDLAADPHEQAPVTEGPAVQAAHAELLAFLDEMKAKRCACARA